MSESREPGRGPAGGPEAPEDLPPKTGAGARGQDSNATNPGMANEGGDEAPDPRGMMGEGAGEDRSQADTSESSGMLNQGADAGRETGGMMGEG